MEQPLQTQASLQKSLFKYKKWKAIQMLKTEQKMASRMSGGVGMRSQGLVGASVTSSTVKTSSLSPLPALGGNFSQII